MLLLFCSVHYYRLATLFAGKMQVNDLYTIQKHIIIGIFILFASYMALCDHDKTGQYHITRFFKSHIKDTRYLLYFWYRKCNFIGITKPCTSTRIWMSAWNLMAHSFMCILYRRVYDVLLRVTLLVYSFVVNDVMNVLSRTDLVGRLVVGCAGYCFSICFAYLEAIK